MVLPNQVSALKLDYPLSLGVYDRYEEAQAAVDYLADQQFEVQNLMIVGTELKQIERITGRLSYPRVALAGAASGAWLGLLFGLILGLFAEPGGWLPLIVTALLLGAAFGVVWGVTGYAFTGGRRDFSSVTQVVATKYELLVEHKLLAQAQELLARQPGRAVDL